MLRQIKERDIQKGILDYLRWRKIFCWKNSNVGIKKSNGSFIPVGMKGVSDILGILPSGKFLAIEVKCKYRKPSPAQKKFLYEIEKNGGLAFVARSVKEVKNEIDKELC